MTAIEAGTRGHITLRQVRVGGAVSIGAASGVDLLDAQITAAIRPQAAA